MDRVHPASDILVAAPERQAEADLDWTFVQRVQAGEVEAFDHLVTKYRERVVSIIYNLTSNREDAADLAQDTFIKAFQSIHRFQGQSSFFTWLYRIAVNGTLTHLRRHRFRRFFSFETLQTEGAPDLVDRLILDPEHDRSLVLKDLQERLNEALQKLSFDHRTVVTLFEVEGLSHKEIGDIVGCSAGTVRSRLHYAKQQLQLHLRDLVA